LRAIRRGEIAAPTAITIMETAALERVQEVMIKTGFTKKRANISAMVDVSYLPN
jgi:hypothetical protein